MLTINIIGAGRLGKTLGKLFKKFEVGYIQAICNQSLQSSTEASNFIHEGKPFSNIQDLPLSDITLIATSDKNIAKSANLLSNSENIKAGSIIFHCSGSLSSEILATLKLKKCYIASIHPMHSFANPELSIERFKGTYCAIEGDLVAQKQLCEMFEKIGAICYEIDSKKKSLYHASGVIASNYLVTLCEEAKKCLIQSGVNEKMSMQIVTNLMLGTTQNLMATQSTTTSLTGPIKRGDSSTIENHMKSFENQEQKKFYSMMGSLTLKIANLPKETEDNLKSTLEQNNEDDEGSYKFNK